MSGHHVTYACSCLNVKIQLANKYYLDRHEQYRQSKFKRIEEPALSGWLFELGVEGVLVEYPNLIRVRRINNNYAGWITINCRNCSTGDVYSVIRHNATSNKSLSEKAMLSQFGDRVLIHQGTIFGQQIEGVQKKAIYSTIFRIVLNPDLPVNYESLEKDEIYGPELQTQRKQVQQLLKQSLIDLEEKTEKKVQACQKEQEILLVREKEKAMYDGAILWQTMKEVSRTNHAEEQRARRLSLSTNKTDQVTFDRVRNVEGQNYVLTDNCQDALEVEMAKRESHVHFAHDTATIDDTQQQRRRSSAIKRDLFGGFAPASYNNRRSSYVLDESAIANSLKNHTSMPLSHRRRSSLVPIRHHHPHQHPLAKHSNNDHNNRSTAMLVRASSNSSSSWEDTEENRSNVGNKSQDNADNDSEDLFPLDEEIENLDNYTYGSQERCATSRGKRPSSKYIEFNEEQVDEDLTRVIQGEGMHDYLFLDEKDNFATSVPITITHSPAFAAKNKIHHNMQKHSSSSSFIESACLVNHNNTSKQPSFVGFDLAETDRRASSVFPPQERRHSTAVKSTTRLPSSYDTQRLTSNKNKIQLEMENQDDDVEEEEYHGPMIPPHIFAANTVIGETEALFGSIPRNSIRNRPVE